MKVNSANYTELAKRTLSGGRTFTNLVHHSSLFSELRQVASATSVLDEFKKRIFYGKHKDLDFNYASDEFNFGNWNHNLFHGLLGAITESGELAVALGYETPDIVNIHEELGDLLWYIAIAADASGTTLDELMEKNIAKLQARYPEKFTEDAALNRNLEKERGVLENKPVSDTDSFDTIKNT